MQFPAEKDTSSGGSRANLPHVKQRASKFSLMVHADGALDAIISLSSSFSRQGESWNYLWVSGSGGRRVEKSSAQKKLKLSNPGKPVQSASAKNLGKSLAYFPQTPYFPDVFPRRVLNALVDARLAFVSYQVYVDQNHAMHYGLTQYKMFSYIFASNETERHCFEMAGIPEKRIAVSGHPLVFQTYLSLQDTKEIAPEKKLLLWAPHWEAAWSHWEESLVAILEFLDANREWKVRFRPHPFFLRSIAGKLPRGYRGVSPSSDEALALLRAFLQDHRIEQSRAGLVQDVVDCHGLLTEGKTIPALWEVSGKPMLVICKDPEEKFVNYWASKNDDVFLNPRPEEIGIRLDKIASRKKTPLSPSSGKSPWLLYENGKPIDPGKIISATINP